MIHVTAYIGAPVRSVRDIRERVGRVESVSLLDLQVAWPGQRPSLPEKVTYKRSDPTLWEDLEVFTLGRGWLSLGTVLGTRPRVVQEKKKAAASRVSVEAVDADDAEAAGFFEVVRRGG